MQERREKPQAVLEGRGLVDPDRAAEHALLMEMLREAERVVDQQAHGLERMDRRAERMLAVGVAALAGGVALATFLMERGPGLSRVSALARLFPGLILNFAGLVALLDAYLGFRRHPDLHIGPSLEWLASKSKDASWELRDHFLTLLDGYPRYAARNTRVMSRMAARIRVGVFLLGAGVTAYAIAYTLMWTWS